MKAVVINADPKRKGNTAKLLNSAVIAAEDKDYEIEYIDLYKMDLSGCRVCLICKRDEECKCYWRDELSAVIDSVFNCDVFLIGVPIFFSQPSSHYMAFLERLIYSMVSYKTGNKFKGKVNVGLFYTINFPKDYFEKSVKPHLKQSEDLLKMLNGEVIIESFYNISKNDRNSDDEKVLDSKEKQFSSDLDKIYELSSTLCG